MGTAKKQSYQELSVGIVQVQFFSAQLFCAFFLLRKFETSEEKKKIGAM